MKTKRQKDLKKEILGEEYSLSVVFADDKLMEELNTKYRNKTGPTNVLSFPLSKDEGEIFINKKYSTKKHEDYADYLMLHSMLHLKGMDHGGKMEAEEDKLLEKFKINNNVLEGC